MSNYIDIDVKNYLERKAGIQNTIIEYLDNDDNFNIDKYFDELKDQENGLNVKELLHLLMSLIDNHHRGKDFFAKNEKMIVYFKDDVKQIFTNTELFDFFSKSKLSLFILIKNQMLEINESNIIYFNNKSFIKYFYPEVLSIDSDYQLQFDDIESFNENRMIGENHNHIAKLIRNDSIEEFVKFINANNISLNSKINGSYFETNRILIDRELNLMEYAVFFGSIQIFQYLKNNNVKLTESLWIYAIHSNNAEIINILEENQIEPNDKSYDNLLLEAIKCHHNNIANYLLENKKNKLFSFI